MSVIAIDESVLDEMVARIKELEAGYCRNNCRTQKEAFIAGYMITRTPHPFDKSGAIVAYKAWRASEKSERTTG